MTAPSQFQASRMLERICDLRVSISGRDHVDADRWGRGAGPGPRFATRAAAARALSALSARAARPRLTAPPAYPPLPAPPPPPPPPPAPPASACASASASASKYPQPPMPPAHVLLHDSGGATSSGGSGAREWREVRDGSFAERASEPPSFGNLRDLSSATSTSRPRTPLGGRRPRGADYLELGDEVVVERVFDDPDEPLSATGAGNVASVPQSPHAHARALPPVFSRLAGRPVFAAGADEIGEEEEEEEEDLEKAVERKERAQPPTWGSPAAPDDTLVPLRSDIPDRPRADAWSALVEDDGVAYFEDAGDVAVGEADGGGTRRRPQLREQMFSNIKSYHHTNLGFDDDDDDFADDDSDSTVNSANTDRSPALYLRKPVHVLHADEAFEESDVSHSFDAASVPLAAAKGFAARMPRHRPAMQLS